MGRLENIAARNRKGLGFRAKVGFLWRGLLILFILGMWIFTDWGVPDEEPPAPRERQLDDVRMLRTRPAAKPDADVKPGDAPPTPR